MTNECQCLSFSIRNNKEPLPIVPDKLLMSGVNIRFLQIMLGGLPHLIGKLAAG